VEQIDKDGRQFNPVSNSPSDAISAKLRALPLAHLQGCAQFSCITWVETTPRRRRSRSSMSASGRRCFAGLSGSDLDLLTSRTRTFLGHG